jgi:hypothetical protein
MCLLPRLPRIMSALQRIAAYGFRIVLLAAMIGLALVLPRIEPLFALALPFWLALELEGSRLAAPRTPARSAVPTAGSGAALST